MRRLLLLLYFFTRGREKKKSYENHEKSVRVPKKSQGSSRSKRRDSASLIISSEKIGNEHTSNPQVSLQRARNTVFYPLTRPFINARAHTHINVAHTSHGCNNTHKKKNWGRERRVFRMQFNNNSVSNPLSPTTGAGGGGEEICRDFLKVCFFVLPARKKLTECILLSQGACFRENCKYSHAHAEGLGAQLPQVRVSSFFLFFADAERDEQRT